MSSAVVLIEPNDAALARKSNMVALARERQGMVHGYNSLPASSIPIGRSNGAIVASSSKARSGMET